MEASVDSYDYDSGDMHRRASELTMARFERGFWCLRRA